MLKKGVVVIDAGTSVEGGSMKGDIDFESVSKKASFLSPVTGGVGPLTVVCLFRNLFLLKGTVLLFCLANILAISCCRGFWYFGGK